MEEDGHEGPATPSSQQTHCHSPLHHAPSTKKKMKAAIKRHFDRKTSISLRNLHKNLGKEKLLMFQDRSDTKKEVGVFANQHTPLKKIQASVGGGFDFEGKMAR